MNMITLKDYSVGFDTLLLNNLNVEFNKGINIIKGKNGCGKTTLIKSLMDIGPQESMGTIMLGDKDITDLETFERGEAGLFLSYQTPPELPGISNFALIKDINNYSAQDIAKNLGKYKAMCEQLQLPKDWHSRFHNVGASGGERKKNEFLHFVFTNPKYILFDELDSGLDEYSRTFIGDYLKDYAKENDCVMLVITHSNEFITEPDYVWEIKDHTIQCLT